MSDVIYVENDNGLNVILNELETEINPEGYIFVRNGEKEIASYAQNIIKPDLDVYSQNKQLAIENTINTQVDEAVVRLNDFTNSECQSHITQAALEAKNEYVSFVEEKNKEVENLVSQANSAAESAQTSETSAASSVTSSLNHSNNSKIWAEGDDSQVQALGGTKSAKGWAEEISDSNLVHRTGDETIEGLKVFNTKAILTLEDNAARQLNLKSTEYDVTEKHAQEYYGVIQFLDKNSKTAGRFDVWNIYENETLARMMAFNKNGTGATIEVHINDDGTVTTHTPTPPVSDNSTQIVTTNWFNQKVQIVSTLPASPDVNVFYFVTNA